MNLGSENSLLCRTGHLSTIIFVDLVWLHIWHSSGSVLIIQETYPSVSSSRVFTAVNNIKRSVFTCSNLYFAFFNV